MDLKTPMYDNHVKQGGKMVSFAGYSMPVNYEEGLIEEHNAVRTKAGMFDVSHMSEIFIEGKDALKNVQKIFANDYSTLKDNHIRYTVMLNDNGGILDDMIIYRMNEEKFLVVGNAANRTKDFDWIKSHVDGEAEAIDRSDDYSLIALQGPNSKEILEKIANPEELPVKYYTFTEDVDVAGVKCMISQTGYTGELGYELYAPAKDGAKLWEAVYEAGLDLDLIPAGLGARDTLRLEAGMNLYGNEMTEDIDPITAGLGWSVKMDKDDFIGKDAVEKVEKTEKLISFKVTGRGIARTGNDILVDGEVVGRVTSGTHSPYLKYPIGLGYIKNDFSDIGRKIVIDVRGREVEAEIIKGPFYKREK